MSHPRLLSSPFAVLCCASLALVSGCSEAPAFDDLDAGGPPGPVGAQLGSGGTLGSGGDLGGGGVLGGGSGGTGGAAVDAGIDAGPVDMGDDGVDVDDDGMDPVEEPRPPCLKSGNQVVLIGDSYINWVSHTFPTDLDNEAGSHFRMYAVGAYSMGSGGIGAIPPQLDQAIAEDPDITTIVMTGGGNDVLVPDTMQFPQGGDCKMSEMAASIPDCQKIVDTALGAAEDMMNGGVSQLAVETVHVVYFFYPNVPEGTIIGGTHPNAILEYAVPKVKDFCDTTYERTEGKVDCHFVDMRPVFAGHPEYFAPTDIHPNLAGSAAMAKAVWQTMEDNCLAQPEASGCCAP